MALTRYALVLPDLAVSGTQEAASPSGLTPAYTSVLNLTEYFALAPTSRLLPVWVAVPSNSPVALGWWASPLGFITGAAPIIKDQTPVINDGSFIFPEVGEIYVRSLNAEVQEISGSGLVTIDYALGRDVELTMDGNVTQLDVVNWPNAGMAASLVLTLINTGAYSVAAWPGTTKYSTGGAAPSVPASAQSCFVLRTRDAGSTIYYDTISAQYSSF